MSGMGVILCERKVLIRLNLKMNGADRRENLLFVNYFLGEENISFFRWGQAHFLPTTPDFNIFPKIPGGKGPPLGCSGEARGLLPVSCVRYCSYFHRGLYFFIVSSFNVLGVEDQQKLQIKNKLD